MNPLCKRLSLVCACILATQDSPPASPFAL